MILAWCGSLQRFLKTPVRHDLIRGGQRELELLTVVLTVFP